MNRGGAETLIMNLYRNMDREKVQFDFLTCKEGVFDSEIQEMGGKIYRIPYVSDVGHFKYVKELDRFFSKHNDYKIIHAHMDKMSGLVLRAAKKAGIPNRISHSHSTSSEGNVVAKCYKWYAGKHILINATNLLACSTKAAKWLFLGEYSRSKIIKNGIECGKFKYSEEVRNEVRDKLNFETDTLVLGHVGRFSTPKNHKLLIDIFREVIKTNPNTVLILVGTGPLLPDIKTKVREYKLTDKVKFLGVRGDVDKLLNGFDAFIFPSLYEGLPVTLIEAQVAGLPCFISDSITQEVDIGANLVEFIPLSNKNGWVERINNFKKDTPRIQLGKDLVKEGYDIKQTANILQDYYSAILR